MERAMGIEPTSEAWDGLRTNEWFIPDCRSDYSAEDRSINPVASPTFRFAKSFSVISTCSLYSPRHSPSGIAVAMLFKIELSLRRILLNLPDNRSSNHSRHFILRCPHVSP